MGAAMPGWAQIIVLSLTLLLAISAGVSSKQASASARRLKRWSESERDIADLRADYQALMESHKRLRSREGMRDLRAARAPPPGPPPGETKAEARARIFGPKAGPDFTRQQLAMEQKPRVADPN